jgi:DNA processing protein
MTDVLEWVALRLVRGVGDATFHRLLRRFGSPGAVFEQPHQALVEAGIPRAIAARLVQGLDTAAARAQVSSAASLGARVVPLPDPAYPAGLLELEDPPPVLWVLGELPGRDARMVGIVGTRAPDGYGLAQALRISAGCARAGVWVLSGGARGIDAAAHEGAMVVGGKTMVVLGSGLDVAYPSEHRALFARVVASGGSVLSELPLGTRPTRGTFPRRNRLIAAMSEALVIVQAGPRSGALLTAAGARKLGRPVLALPGPVDKAPSVGAHQLLREGAKLCEGPGDALAALGLAEPPVPPPPARPAGSPERDRVLRALEQGPLMFDELAAQAGLGLARAADVLLALEIEGSVELARGHYRKV